VSEPLTASPQLNFTVAFCLYWEISSVYFFGLFVDSVKEDRQKFMSVMLIVAQEVLDMTINIIFKFLSFFPKNRFTGRRFFELS